MAEIVYVVTNEAMPGLTKIGCTTDDLAGRIRGLFGTGVPLPFELLYACEVNDCRFVERQLHDAFGDHRLSKSREFFRIAPERKPDDPEQSKRFIETAEEVGADRDDEALESDS
jgi:hypothetical protein